MESWKKITSDRFIIDIVRNGPKIDFEDEPINDYVPNAPYKSDKIKIVSEEIAKLLQKGAIIECESPPPLLFYENEGCCQSHLLMIHIYRVQQKYRVIKMLMQQ